MSSARYRVDLPNGYISFSEEQKDKAYELYNDKQYSAIRIRYCVNIGDDGIVVLGSPLYEDFTLN